MKLGAMILATMGAFLFTGCTAKYQQKILDLNDRCAQLQQDLTMKQRQNLELGSRVRQLKSEREQLELRYNRIKGKGTGGGNPFKGLKQTSGVSFRDGKLVLSDQVTFRSGSRTISKQGQEILGTVAKLLKTKHAGKRVFIMGHTDSDPIKKTKKKYRSNRHLSSERADAVAAYLVKKGVSDKVIAIMGYGFTDAVTANQNARDKARNRRVEIMIGLSLK